MMRIPIAKEGYPFIAIAVLVVLVFWLAGLCWLFYLALALAVFVVAFFRDPERSIPGGDAVVSSADGRVIKVEIVEEERFLKAKALKICVFMNVFNVHVNRAPMAGKVVGVHYNPGKFFNASFDKASLLNEQNAIVMQTESGKQFLAIQIAGLVARRIVCYAREGQSFKKGERIGIIRFGSRVDLYLPPDAEALVKVGDKVSAGSSVVALLKP
jgi:phosphatidylserine decarboxylase